MGFDSSSIDVSTETVIGRSPEVVAAFAGDPGNAPEWYSRVSSAEWQTEPPLAVGSRLEFVAHFLGRRLAYTYEVVELVPNELLVMRTAGGPFPNGDELRVGGDRKWGNPHELAQSGNAERLLPPGRSVHEAGNQTSEHQGPERAQEAA